MNIEVMAGPLLMNVKPKHIDIHDRWYFSLSYIAKWDDDYETDYIIIDIIDKSDMKKVIRMTEMEYNEFPELLFTEDFMEWSKTISGYEMMGIYYTRPSIELINELLERNYEPFTVLKYHYS